MVRQKAILLRLTFGLCTLAAVLICAALAQSPVQLEPALLAEAKRIAPAPQDSNLLMSGGGFFISSDGLVITAKHVVNQCREISIASNSVKGVEAKLVGSNSKTDIAELLAKTTSQVPFLSFSPPSLDSNLIVLGYPLGHDVAKATIAQAKTISSESMSNPIDPKIVIFMTSSSVTEGFSGGPIVEADTGHVIGVLHGGYERATAQKDFGIRSENLKVGDGIVMLDLFYARLPPYLRPPITATQSYTSAEQVAATVHVFCWR